MSSCRCKLKKGLCIVCECIGTAYTSMYSWKSSCMCKLCWCTHKFYIQRTFNVNLFPILSFFIDDTHHYHVTIIFQSCVLRSNTYCGQSDTIVVSRRLPPYCLHSVLKKVVPAGRSSSSYERIKNKQVNLLLSNHKRENDIL
jgi:hypothetical protein